MGNIAIGEYVKGAEKNGKKIVGKPKAIPKAKVAVKSPESAAVKVSDISPELEQLLSKVAASMNGKSEGTLKSAQSLILKVCKKYNVTSIDAELAKKAVEESDLPVRF